MKHIKNLKRKEKLGKENKKERDKEENEDRNKIIIKIQKRNKEQGLFINPDKERIIGMSKEKGNFRRGCVILISCTKRIVE